MTTNPAATPVPVEDVQGDRRWMDMHEHYVREAHEKEPEVLFVGDSLILQLAHTQTIPPRGHQPNPLRVKNEEVNQRIASLLQSFPSVQLVDVCQGLLQSDGTINHNDMYDYLHLTSSGYAKFCEPLYCALAEILKMQDATALAMDAADNLVETPD
uniref:SGNH hydrolase-type esterase domain-containing protein n=1 Tax=Branchiostoma floridae TaxID=7739 RepID=C3Y0T9_BRAFL|eukprot:XP_002610062.1 hypothetical protein BRAFLDRAFT_125684 [Branchiostoma floridae]